MSAPATGTGVGAMHVATAPLAVLLLALAAAAPARAAEPKASLVAPPTGITVVAATATAAPAASAPAGPLATGSLLVAVEGLDPGARPAEGEPGFLAKPVDVTAPTTTSTPDLKFGEPRALGTTGPQRSWLLPFTVTGLPAGADQTRYLGFKLGGQDRTLAWRLTSPAAAPSSWALKPVPVAERAIDTGDGVPIGITVSGAQAVQGLRLGPVELIEPGMKRSLSAGQLALCTTMAPCEAKPIKLDGNDLHTLWLMPLKAPGRDTAPLPPGKYSGNLTIASGDKPAGETVAITVQVSSLGWRLLGVAVILLGVVLAWFSTTYLRYRINRNQLLLPALVWRETAARLGAQLAALALPAAMDGAAGRLAKVDDDLSDKVLERNQLPPAVPLPGSTAISSTALDSYRKHLEGVGAWVTAVQVLIEHGLQPLQARRTTLLTKGHAHVAALDGTLKLLDDLARSATLPVAETVAQNVALALADLQAELDRLDAPTAAQRGMAGDGASARSALPRPRPTVEQLRLQIAAESFAAWGFILATTLVAGSYMLVFKNPGFGTPLDLLEALLWGLGLPAAAQLTAATTSPTTIASTFSVLR